jgi:uncharacterized sulfatase
MFTLAKGLRAAGYRTAICGKWHLTSNADGNYRGLRPETATHYGFDHAPPLLDASHFAEGADRGVAKLTDQAIEFIERNRDRPWFCFLSHHMIHGPVVAPEALTNKYRAQGYGDQGPNRAVYLAGLECLDRSVGRLMQRLDDWGMSDNTLVVFLSDNGGIDERFAFRDLPQPPPARPVFQPDLVEYDNHPLRAGKGSIYEGGVRVPMIVRWPSEIPAGTVIDTPVHVVDVLPTCFELAGVAAPDNHALDGTSLVTLMTEGRDDRLAERPVFQYYPFYDLRWGLTPSASIRQGDHKLIEFFGDRVDRQRRYQPGRAIELYDLRKDPGETQNLADERPALARRLKRRLHRWMRETGAEQPRANPHHQPERAFWETRDKPPWLRGVRWRSAPATGQGQLGKNGERAGE